MFRLTTRLSCQFKELLSSAEGQALLQKVQEALCSVKEGKAESTSEKTVDSSLISCWESVTKEQSRLAETQNELQAIGQLLTSDDKEMKRMAEEERQKLETELDDIYLKLADSLVRPDSFDVLTKCQMEFSSGAGGQEAMLFTGELVKMYEKYATFRGWKWEPYELDTVGLGGTRSALIAVEGPESYATLRFEAGVHRVQRIPATDKSRMHTSTASLAILPEPEEVSVILPSDSVKIETMRASGPGGQNVNKRSTAVRITHKETGISVHAMDERFQHMNIKIAYKRLAALLLQQKLDKISEKTTSSRKLQVGSRARAEKIRTYNFQRDFIADHRVGMQLTGVEEFMQVPSYDLPKNPT
ncbi:hypothetical protein WR25_03264 [Diploscapter pachys]|uniref:Prokaryotic-type class I peptide chain release factors domain-containing protein n=1 Tax=Diploscapter pachys TaxID=2018661 RepID=A0A2A2JQ65_9BILA|nr:hypothetical protein WR25_03264 [Diploscapter pachys]